MSARTRPALFPILALVAAAAALATAVVLWRRGPAVPPPAPAPVATNLPQRFIVRGWCEFANAEPAQILPIDPTGAPGTVRGCPRDAIVRFTYRTPVGGALFVLQDVDGALSWVSPLGAEAIPTGLRETNEPKALPVRLRPPLPEGGPQLLFVLAPPGTTGTEVMAAATELRATEAIAERLRGRATVLSIPTR